jgi:predicted DNA binding CopG/RHH family protein
MVKKITIGTKPSPVSDPAQIDQWVAERGESNDTKSNDAESQSPISTPESVKMKRLTLDIPEDLHKAIKTKAVVEGVPMANMLRSLLEQYYGNQ